MLASLRTIQVPSLIRVKSGAFQRLPLYLKRLQFGSLLVLLSDGLPVFVRASLNSLSLARVIEVEQASVEWLDSIAGDLSGYHAVCGLGGGKALDAAKLLAYRLDLPYIAVPTSLSNDGFCSPQASLLVQGRKASQAARLPVGVVIDIDIVQQAPLRLWLSGVGDLVSKRTAIKDWKIAFHAGKTPFDDLAAMLSDASVFQFMAHPARDQRGTRLLAQSLLFNGVAMEIAGCSRPASGSEHLISHALDQIASPPHLHGLQVGLATYLMGIVQGQDVSDIDSLFETTGFWAYWQEHPMPKRLWQQAIELAPSLKKDFITILDDKEAHERALELLDGNPRLVSCLS